MKYLFLDVDQTLYSSVLGAVPDSALAAIRQARANGSRVFLCTGRSLAECSKYLNMELDGFVFAAGGMIYAEGKRIYDHPMDKSLVSVIQQYLSSYGLGWSLEGLAGAYCDEEAYEYLLPYFSGGQKPRNVMIQQTMANCCYPYQYMDEEEKIYKICGFTRRTDVDFAAMKQHVPAGCTLVVTLQSENGCGCEVTNRDITKASGIQRVLDWYHASMADAVAIGDSENDLPMIRACGTGIAMGNAFQSVKKEADWVTTDILDDGIWNAFRHVGVI